MTAARLRLLGNRDGRLGSVTVGVLDICIQVHRGRYGATSASPLPVVLLRPRVIGRGDALRHHLRGTERRKGRVHSAQGLEILETTGAAGLMLGRGAIADPLLFARIRDQKLTEPVPAETALMIRRYLAAVLERYRELFCGEQQVLDKAKNVLAFLDQPELARPIGKLKRARSLASFADLLEQIEPS